MIQVDYVRVVDLDIGANKSDICAIRVVTISERAGRTRACNRGSTACGDVICPVRGQTIRPM